MTPTLAGPPTEPVAVPEVVVEIAAGRRLEPVWVNELGGVTWRLPGAGLFVKWAPAGCGLDLTAEAARLAWASAWTSVPHVVDTGLSEGGSWLVTEAVEAMSAVSARWLASPEVAVTAVGEGLRALHDALPVAGCPWSWSVEHRMAGSVQRAAALIGAGRPQPAWGDPAALAALGPRPVIDRLVVCHGDPCAPNTLVDDRGRFAAHVDLGTLGVADRWADLAVATASCGWNYGPGWDDVLLRSYGITPDAERTTFYRRLWDLT